MNTERFIAKRIIFGAPSNNQLSRPIIRISVLGIALGMALMILTVAIVTGFQQEIKNKLIGFGSHIQITNYDDNRSDEPLPIAKNQDFLKELEKNTDVTHIQIFATKNGIIKTKNDNEGVLLKGIGADYDWEFITKNLKEGKIVSISDTAISKNIIISKYLADKLEIKINDKMIIYFLTKKIDEADETTRYEQRVKTFFVSGIYETGFEEIDKKLVLVDIRQIQKINYWNENQIGGFEITIKDAFEKAISTKQKIDLLKDEIDGLVGQGLVAQTIKETNPSIFSWLELQDINAIIVISLMLLVAGINMISVLLILILERTNMIGILKALGASNFSIQKIFLHNALYIIIRGLIIGNSIGIGVAWAQQHFGLLQLDAKQYYVSMVPIHLDFLHILFLNAATLLACFIMLIIPSFIVSKITPIKAIRFS